MDIKVTFKAGGSFVKLPPQFSSNAETVYVAWKNKILGYNVKTGALFTEFKGLKDQIVGFGVHYNDSYECVTACSSSGEIMSWKIVTFFKILNKKLDDRNVVTFHILPFEEGTKALISFKQQERILFQIIDLTNLKIQPCGLTINSKLYHVAVCSNKYFAVVQKRSLNVVRFNDPKKSYTYCIESPRKFKNVACHPEDETILTGDNTGRCVVWKNLFTPKPSKAVFHWHTLPVKSIAFSATGSYFYSGGDESVLVQWQVDNNHEKKFLPRLPSTIAKITVSPNNNFIAIATDDNAVRIVDARFDSVSLIQHLVIGNNFESGMVVDQKTRALIMNGNVGQIQFYSVSDNSLLYNVDVVGQNKISNERNCNIENTQVSKIAISDGGLWMASVEIRRDPEFSAELRLKLWKFDFGIQNYKLNTCVESPHENCVNSIAFQPSESIEELKLVTVGGDKKFKVWQLTEVETVDKKTEVWRCLCFGYYHDLPCKALSFSIDGSLVAVSFGNSVTTWLPDSCHLKCSLSHPVCKEEINQVEFGTSNQCHLIVAASSDRLSVWNLLTLTMLWTVPVNVSILIADTVTTSMAVITEENAIFVFSPISPEPVFSSEEILRKHVDIYTAAFVPSKYSNDTRLGWEQRSPIFFLDSKKELFRLGAEEDSLENVNEIYDITKSMFSMTIPESENNKSTGKGPVYHLYQAEGGEKNIKKFLEAPIHTMIPIRLMCGSLLRSMALKKP